MIEHDNIIYIRDFTEIGGVETFTYELAKRYKDLDIAVVCKTICTNQLKRIRKICPIYIHYDQKVICKVAIINYDSSFIKYICNEAKIYQVIHADYSNPVYKSVPTHERVYKYIAITKHIMKTFKELTGVNNIIQIYNPLEILVYEKRLVLISMTRLSKEKGKERMKLLARSLDQAKIPYIWYVFTNDTDEIDSENVIYLKPRLDVGYFLEQADYLVQLSDTEGLSYSINEALYRNIPVIVTPLPYLKEIGVIDKVNSYILEFDCSNIKDIVKNINNKPKFNFKKLNDSYDDILVR